MTADDLATSGAKSSAVMNDIDIVIPQTRNTCPINSDKWKYSECSLANPLNFNWGYAKLSMDIAVKYIGGNNNKIVIKPDT